MKFQVDDIYVQLGQIDHDDAILDHKSKTSSNIYWLKEKREFSKHNKLL